MNIIFCCIKMSAAIDSKAFQLKDNEILIKKNDCEIAFSYCPFCTEKINISIADNSTIEE